jgi:hypothetical protein
MERNEMYFEVRQCIPEQERAVAFSTNMAHSLPSEVSVKNAI